MGAWPGPMRAKTIAESGSKVFGKVQKNTKKYLEIDCAKML